MKTGTYRSIPIYIKKARYDFLDIEGKNYFWDLLVKLNLWWDLKVLELDIEELPIEIDYRDENNLNV